MNVKCYTQMFRSKLYFYKDKKVYCGLGTIMATFTITHHDATLNFMELWKHPSHNPWHWASKGRRLEHVSSAEWLLSGHRGLWSASLLILVLSYDSHSLLRLYWEFCSNSVTDATSRVAKCNTSMFFFSYFCANYNHGLRDYVFLWTRYLRNALREFL